MALQSGVLKKEWTREYQMAVLKPEKNASNYTIYHRDESGSPNFQYIPNDGVTNCLAKSINLCREILKHPKASEGLTNQAGMYVSIPGHPADPRKMKTLADAFLQMVDERFPNVFVDDSLQSLNTGGGHWRFPFTGTFRTSDQYIFLNGTLIKRMLAAAIVAQGAVDEEYGRFIFHSATILVHEISHVFFTYLSQGEGLTPPVITAKLGTVDPIGSSGTIEGEAGLDLESWIFGGRLYHSRDPLIETSKYGCGMAYLRNPTGFYRIEKKTIMETVNGNFKFPIEHMAEPERLPLSGLSDVPTPNFHSHPFDHPAWPKLRDAPPPTDS